MVRTLALVTASEARDNIRPHKREFKFAFTLMVESKEELTEEEAFELAASYAGFVGHSGGLIEDSFVRVVQVDSLKDSVTYYLNNERREDNWFYPKAK